MQSVVTGQAPITLEWCNTSGGKRKTIRRTLVAITHQNILTETNRIQPHSKNPKVRSTYARFRHLYMIPVVHNTLNESQPKPRRQLIPTRRQDKTYRRPSRNRRRGGKNKKNREMKARKQERTKNTQPGTHIRRCSACTRYVLWYVPRSALPGIYILYYPLVPGVRYLPPGGHFCSV